MTRYLPFGNARWWFGFKVTVRPLFPEPVSRLSTLLLYSTHVSWHPNTSWSVSLPKDQDSLSPPLLIAYAGLMPNSHKIFQLQDIVDLVVQQLAASETWPPQRASDLGDAHSLLRKVGWNARQHLRTLGQVGRIFREPCLNALWYDQEGLVKLFFMVSAIEPVEEGSSRKEWVRVS